jgi:hypothetical protein
LSDTNELRLVITGDPSGGVKAFEDISKVVADFSKVFTEMATRVTESATAIRETIGIMAKDVADSKTAFSGRVG